MQAAPAWVQNGANPEKASCSALRKQLALAFRAWARNVVPHLKTVNAHLITFTRLLLRMMLLRGTGFPVTNGAMAKQQSIPEFDEDEQKLIDEAMRIDHIKTQGVWVRRAAMMWATKVVADDLGLTAKVDKAVGRS
jgi:hypothetical protein